MAGSAGKTFYSEMPREVFKSLTGHGQAVAIIQANANKAAEPYAKCRDPHARCSRRRREANAATAMNLFNPLSVWPLLNAGDRRQHKRRDAPALVNAPAHQK